jgi:hypothetical protein
MIIDPCPNKVAHNNWDDGEDRAPKRSGSAILSWRVYTVSMTEPIIAARVHPGEEHYCGGTIHEARGQYGRFLGCSNAECQTAWDANGWKFTGKRELYDHGNHGLPDQFEPVMHPGDWRHHGLGIRLSNYKGDFTPEKAPDVVTEEISV